MVTLGEFAQMADLVYGGRGGFGLPGWTNVDFRADRPVWKGGSLFTNGFQGGALFRSSTRELVVAFKGTVPSMAADLAADVGIALQQIPEQAETARSFTVACRNSCPGARTYLVGHSLGGGLCQVVGSWLGLLFVTFNAPAMGTNWFAAHLNVLAPRDLVRTVFGRRSDDSVNYRLLNDPVSKLGNHIGRVVKIDGGLGVVDAHGMGRFKEIILGRADLRDADPFAGATGKQAAGR